MSLPLVFAFYFLFSAALVYFSIKCADYVDLLDKKTSMSGAFIGGVILAAVTSLPELVTSISSIYAVQNPGLIIGNVLGSNLFNLCIFGALTALSVKTFAKCKIGKAHLATIACTIVADILMVLTLLLDPAYTRIPYLEINGASLMILIIYFISLRYLSNDDTQNEEDDTSPLTVKQIAIRFVLMALGLVGMSVMVTYFADQLQEKLQLGASIAGAVFLGVTTSLPELTSSITLVRRRNFNAMVGNVVGSNMFNFTIFSIADFIAGKTYVYERSDASLQMICFGALSTILVASSILLQNRFKHAVPEKRNKLLVYILLGAGVCTCYIIPLLFGAT